VALIVAKSPKRVPDAAGLETWFALHALIDNRSQRSLDTSLLFDTNRLLKAIQFSSPLLRPLRSAGSGNAPQNTPHQQ